MSEVKFFSYEEMKERWSNPPKDAEELVKEDLQFWLNKDGVRPEKNFEILKNCKNSVGFYEFEEDGKAVSHFAIQLLNCGNGRVIGYIFWLYTMQEYRSKRITQALLRAVCKAMLSSFAQLSHIGLRTDYNNHIMQHVIEKIGFFRGATLVEVDSSSDVPEYEYIITKESLEKADEG